MAAKTTTTSLKNRLTAIEARMAKNRSALVGRGRVSPEDIATIADFENRVKRLQAALAGETEIDVMPSGSNGLEFETMSLEAALTEWVRDLDGRFNAPAKRNPSVSM